jgi:hypothetical protein
MAYRQRTFPSSAGTGTGSRGSRQKIRASLAPSGTMSRVDFHIDGKSGKGMPVRSLIQNAVELTHTGSAITSLHIPYARWDPEVFLDLESYLIRAKKDQPLPDEMPDSLKSFTIDSGLCKGPTLTFVGTGTLPLRLPEPSSSKSSSSDEELTIKGKTVDEVPKGDTGVVTSLETEFFGLKGGAQL